MKLFVLAAAAAAVVSLGLADAASARSPLPKCAPPHHTVQPVPGKPNMEQPPRKEVGERKRPPHSEVHCLGPKEIAELRKDRRIRLLRKHHGPAHGPRHHGGRPHRR